MKLFFLLINFLFSVIMIGQSPSLEKKMFNKMCECLSEILTPENNFDTKKFNACWLRDTAFINELTEFIESTDTINSYEDGVKFGRDLFNNNQIRLINECDNWFHFLDSARYDFSKDVDKQEQQKQIDSLTKLISKEPGNSSLYQERGLAYFMLLKTVEAKADFESALSLPEANSQSLYFRGWISEINGNYDDAINDYKLAKKITGNAYLDTVIAIAERKKKEKK